MEIREARESDLTAIRQVHLNAFGEEGETIAELVSALFVDATAQPLLALVAETGGEVVGNVIFSTVRIEGAGTVSACILAPLAVARRHQGRGIGRALIERGLSVLRARGVDAVFVLGDPRYYGPRGFSAHHRVRAPYDILYPEAWMAIALQGDPLESLSGQLVCPRALSDPKYW
ncbi:MAG TPA: N-acetyltransferase [Gammaproteobacteria bacterium]|nr:N-acetyltransferase [Gammaproteobacteria bacterium]